MIVAIFAVVLAMIGAGATIVCSLMYFKKCGHASKMSLKPSATRGEQRSQTVLKRNQYKDALPYMVSFAIYHQINMTTQQILSQSKAKVHIISCDS